MACNETAKFFQIDSAPVAPTAAMTARSTLSALPEEADEVGEVTSSPKPHDARQDAGAAWHTPPNARFSLATPWQHPLPHFLGLFPRYSDDVSHVIIE